MFDFTAFVFTIFLAVVSYLIGNISPATIMGHVYGVDIRKEGSGNPGTTNVLRSLGKKAAAITLLIDILKGLIPVIVGRWLGDPVTGYICGTAAFFGHIVPVFYKFKGGKGIATGFGVILAIDWKAGLICLAAAAVATLLTRRMSCGSIAAAITLPITIYFFEGYPYYIWAICLALVVIWRHRSNIQRIIHGDEPTMSFGKKTAEKTADSIENKAEDKAENKTENKAEDKTGNKAGNGTENKAEDETGNKAGDIAENSTGDKK